MFSLLKKLYNIEGNTQKKVQMEGNTKKKGAESKEQNEKLSQALNEIMDNQLFNINCPLLFRIAQNPVADVKDVKHIVPALKELFIQKVSLQLWVGHCLNATQSISL